VVARVGQMFKLLPTQRASLYEVLTAIDFNPSDFDIVKTSHRHLGDGEAVKLKKTEFHFAIYKDPSEYSHHKFFVTFSPGAEEIRELAECYDWNSVLAKFEYYLIVLRRELSVTDPWENAKEYADKLQAVPQTGAGNRPFTGKEKDDVQKTLKDIKQLLLDEVKNDEKKQQYLTDQFSMLNDAVTKFGKKDYLMLVYTAVIGMATTVGVSPGVGTQIWQMLNGLLSHVPRLIS
jgi:hypothetical protein